MPKMYEAIKKSCKKSGGSDKDCKTKAAKIYNAFAKKVGKKPVTRKTK